VISPRYIWKYQLTLRIAYKDHKVYLQQQFTNEQVPYGINMVNALNVPDDNVSNRKVCIIDTGYDLKHPDLPNESTGAAITGTAPNGLVWSEDGSKYLLSAL